MQADHNERKQVMVDNQMIPQAVEPVPNLPLLRKVLDHIDAHPEEWDQGSFEAPTQCGTTRCVAGWVAFWEEGNTLAADAVARLALGLTMDESDDLFYGTLDGQDMRTVADCPEATDRERVQMVAESIAARAGERL